MARVSASSADRSGMFRGEPVMRHAATHTAFLRRAMHIEISNKSEMDMTASSRTLMYALLSAARQLISSMAIVEMVFDRKARGLGEQIER